ncbi:glutathione-dependent formaldehyde dehydrogenase [Tessaracoccus sp. MC1627]|nr:glutathione-dependent formaldehyde dehydrogenase [Tessaracoccus sp. MC1627]
MRAVTWQGRGKVELTEVPDPAIENPTDVVVRVTSTAICGSDLHLIGPLTPFMTRGDVLGHEFMGVVEEIGSQITHLRVGDRVVVPFNISCGSCFMCSRGLHSQCETTQVREYGTGAALFGYTKLYGQVPGGQAEFVRVPQAQFGPIKLPETGPDERWLYLSDILPTAWQAVKYAELQPGETLAVIGLGPVGQLVARAAREQGAGRVIAVDYVPERLALARESGFEVIHAGGVGDVSGAIRELTQGRGADRVVDAVGMEAHGSPVAHAAIGMVTTLPKPVAAALTQTLGVDRLAALETALGSVRRGGTVSLAGVYGGAVDPLNLMRLFDAQVTVRMGQANVRRWTDELFEILSREDDVFGVEGFATHHLPLDEAPHAYSVFREKKDGCIKVVLHP